MTRAWFGALRGRLDEKSSNARDRVHTERGGQVVGPRSEPGPRVVDWSGAERAGPRGRDRRKDDRRRRHLPGARRRQGRPGRPQRRRQDHPVQGPRRGRRRPSAGTVRRRRAPPATSPRTPGRRPSPTTPTAWPTCCPAGASTRPPTDLEKLRHRHGGGPVRAQHRPVLRRPGALRERRRLRRRVRGPPPRRRPRARAADRLDLTLGCPLGWRAPARSSWPGSSSPAATCCCSTSPPTTSTPTPATGCCGSSAATGAPCSSSATTSTCSTRPSPA